MKDSFKSYHPIINFLYFALVLLFSMFFMNPLSLFISCFSAFSYSFYQNSRKTTKMSFLYMLPMMLMTALINPLFNHEGITILWYFPSGNPLTLESIYYGIASAFMLFSVIIWFSCYSNVITSDKFVYLFGKIIPTLSLVLSMTLRFIPKFIAQFNVVCEAQKYLGRTTDGKNYIYKIKQTVKILSIMLTWSLENAIETADSMKSRGYGLPNRTAFSIYKFDERDKITLIWLVFCGVYVISGWFLGAFYSSYFPILKLSDISPFMLSFQLIYLALCLTPIFINKTEDYKWKQLLKKG